MEMFYEKGLSRKDCELKIAEKYKRPFHVLCEKEVRIGGFLGIFSRPGIEVGFYFSPVVYKNPLTQGNYTGAPASWQITDNFAQMQQNAGIKQYNPNFQNPMELYPQGPRANSFPKESASVLEEEKRKIIAAAGKNYEQVSASMTAAGNEASQKILDSLKEIKEKIDLSGSKKEEHPSFVQAAELLKLNDFSEKYINAMLDRMRRELTLETLEDFEAVQNNLLEWIGESISIYKEEKSGRKPRVMILVGPTGVGKTTTIAKLAAIYGIGTDAIPSVSVRMITIDAFRIGAAEQLKSYGGIMELPVSCVDNKMSLRKEIALFSEDTDLFLIDTIGKSPRDSAKLGEVREILEGCGKGAEVHLVLGACTKTSDIEDILRHFEPFNYRSVVLSKLDETDHIGNVISALAEKRKSVSYITDGQKVPNDIKKAAVVRFLINLDGFKVDRGKIENRFPSGEADQFKWK
ncbi:MAG: flagellar biosynthesis protein FlhF [Treponema sp.]|nr:flagellar biosynthesis protein FlhF [Treponema sp.]